MPGWLKAVLIVAVVVILLVVGVVGAGVFWLMRNKDGLRSRARAIVAEGKAFGKTTDNQGCVDEAVKRYKRDPGLLSAIANQGFLDGCLKVSQPTIGFCENIPLGDFAKMGKWRESQCKRYDLQSGRDCQALVMPVTMFCGDKKQNQN
jgi:hypothetical protein